MSHNPDQLSQLLLEADGLLLLLHKHRDETPIDAIKLLRKKLELILALTEDLDEEQSCVYECPEPQSVVEEHSYIVGDDTEQDSKDIDTDDSQVTEKTEATTNDFTESAETQDKIEDYPTEDSVESTITDENEVAESVTDEITDVEETNQPDNEPESVTSIYEVDETETQPEFTTTDYTPVFFERDREPAVFAEEKAEESAPEVPVYRHTYVIKDTNDLKSENETTRRPVSSVFNLNDKFRFRRELFGNSDAQYVECLDLLSAMSSLDEAKEYLYEDLKWDSENEDVKAFIELLSNYYK